MQPLSWTKTHLTGRIRFRIGRFGKLVTQLEYRQERYSGAPPMHGQAKEPQSISLKWRDAKGNDSDVLMRMGAFQSEG